jgi:hypothetical protein
MSRTQWALVAVGFLGFGLAALRHYAGGQLSRRGQAAGESLRSAWRKACRLDRGWRCSVR